MSWQIQIQIEGKIFLVPANARYQLPMYIVLFHICFYQIFHELFKGGLWISFLPFSPGCNTNGSSICCKFITLFRVVHLDVEVRSEELLAPALLCHKERARASKAPYAGSLWHKGAYNRTFPCMEATYPLCHKEPARSKQNTPQWGYFAFQSP